MQGIDLQPIDIMKDPPSKKTFSELISKYGAREMVRRNSRDYKELRVGKMKLSGRELAALFNAHPDLTKRPIVLVNGEAYLSKDPRFLEHLKEPHDKIEKVIPAN